MANPFVFLSPIARLLRPYFEPILKPILRPITRAFVGFIAIPIFRFILRYVFRVREIDEEMEKDLGEWFRGSMLLLFATHNMEETLFGEIELVDGGKLATLIVAGRLLLAIAAIESMPDQQLFSIIHPGPPKLTYDKAKGFWGNVAEQWWPLLRGMLCRHLNQSSPVFAILAVIVEGEIGWACFVVAIVQYLIIGLVTSRDRALDVLSQFDRRVAERRREIIEEFDINQDETEAPIDVPPPTKVVHLR